MEVVLHHLPLQLPPLTERVAMSPVIRVAGDVDGHRHHHEQEQRQDGRPQAVGESLHEPCLALAGALAPEEEDEQGRRTRERPRPLGAQGHAAGDAAGYEPAAPSAVLDVAQRAQEADSPSRRRRRCRGWRCATGRCRACRPPPAPGRPETSAAISPAVAQEGRRRRAAAGRPARVRCAGRKACCRRSGCRLRWRTCPSRGAARRPPSRAATSGTSAARTLPCRMVSASLL